MVTLLLDQTQLEVVLSVTERALSFRKGNVVVDRSTITKVQLTDDAWTWLRGRPEPGTYLRGVIAMGSWKSAGGTDFALVRRHRASVVIDLEGHDQYERLILTTRHGLALVKALRLDVAEEASMSSNRRRDGIAAAAGKKPRARKAPAPAPAV